jgi:hypothetical protein
VDQCRAEDGAAHPGIESHSTRSEAAGDDLDGKTLAAMFRGRSARAVEEIERDPTPYFITSSARPAACWSPTNSRPGVFCTPAPQPYTRERFDDTYDWTVKWNMTVPGATYESIVDNLAPGSSGNGALT